MNFWAQSIASPFRVTPRYDAQKSQTPVSGSVVYNKMPGSLKIGKEREEEKKKAALTKGREKTLWTRNERWIIQGHQQAQCDLVYRLLQKSASLEDFVSVYRTNHIKGEKKGRNQNQTITCWFSTCWGLKWNCCYWRRDWIYSCYTRSNYAAVLA